jgi:uncharacterized membrane protein
MTKLEFLDTLRSVLAGEVPESEIESNIKFYDDYIRNESRDNGEEYVLEQLGNPRLIAKTIIETYQVSHGPVYNNMKHSGSYNTNSNANTTKENNYQNQNTNAYEEGNRSDRYQNDTYNNDSYKKSEFNDSGINGEDRRKGNYGFYNVSLSVFQKIILTVILVLVIILFIFVGSIVLQLFLTYVLPILLVYIIIKGLSNRRH